MEPRMFQVLIQDLAKALGIEEWDSTRKEVVTVKLGDRTTLFIDGSEESLVLRATLGVAVTVDDLAALETMLQGNLLGQQTGGSCLGLDGEEPVLWKKLIPGLTPRDVLLELEDFSNYAEVWVKLIDEAKQKQ